MKMPPGGVSGRARQVVTVEQLETRCLLSASLDPNYGDPATPGIHYEFIDGQAESGVRLDDGSYVMAYDVDGTGYTWNLVRYTAGGERDWSFGFNGYATVYPPGPGELELLASPGNRFVAVVYEDGPYYTDFYRFNADGYEDPSFGFGGFNQVLVDDIEVDVDASGGLILSGETDLQLFGGNLNDLELLRLGPDGMADATFGTHSQFVGSERFGFFTVPALEPTAHWMTVDVADQDYLMIGGGRNDRRDLARVVPGGLGFDTSFGINGVATDWAPGSVRSITSLPSGKFITITETSFSDDYLIDLYNADGDPVDIGNDGAGRPMPDTADDHRVLEPQIEIDPFGNVVVGGMVERLTNEPMVRTAFTRFTPNLDLDIGYAGMTSFEFDVFSRPYYFAADLLDFGFEPDGRLRGVTGTVDYPELAFFAVKSEAASGLSVEVIDHVLTIRGGAQSDDVELAYENGYIVVRAPGSGLGPWQFTRPDVQQIDVDLGGGDDRLGVDFKLEPPMTFAGGDGDDLLHLIGTDESDNIELTSGFFRLNYGFYSLFSEFEQITVDLHGGSDFADIDVYFDTPIDIVINGGNGGNILRFDSVPGLSHSLVVNGGSSYDEYFISARFLGNLNINENGGDLNRLYYVGSTSADTVSLHRLNSANPPAVRLQVGTTSYANVTANYMSRVDLDTGLGDDNIHLHGMSPGTLIVDADQGNDHLHFGSSSLPNASGTSAFADVVFSLDLGDGVDQTTIHAVEPTAAVQSPMHMTGTNLQYAARGLDLRLPSLVETINFIGNSLDNRFIVRPVGSANVHVVGHANTTADPGDELDLWVPPGSSASYTGNGPGAGAFSFTGGYLPVSFEGIETHDGDDNDGPQLRDMNFFYQTGQEVFIRFLEDVADSLVSSGFFVTNTDTGQQLPASDFDFIVGQPASGMTEVLLRARGTLPNGNYRATVAAGSFADANGNRSTQDFTHAFFILAGDANRDRKVDLADFVILRNNFGQPGSVFSQGDFNYDGNVDLSDFVILRNNFGQSVDDPDEGPGLF